MNLSIEYLVDFSSGEQIAEFVTTADGYNIVADFMSCHQTALMNCL